MSCVFDQGDDNINADFRVKENPDGSVVFESVSCPGINIGIQAGPQYVVGLSINLVVCLSMFVRACVCMWCCVCGVCVWVCVVCVCVVSVCGIVCVCGVCVVCGVCGGACMLHIDVLHKSYPHVICTVIKMQLVLMGVACDFRVVERCTSLKGKHIYLLCHFLQSALLHFVYTHAALFPQGIQNFGGSQTITK